MRDREIKRHIQMENLSAFTEILAFIFSTIQKSSTEMVSSDGIIP